MMHYNDGANFLELFQKAFPSKEISYIQAYFQLRILIHVTKDFVRLHSLCLFISVR